MPPSDDELERLYGYPPDRRWLAINFVSSVDGAVAVNGRSAELSNAADRRVYRLGADLADVVLIGAGTAVAERYRGIRPDEIGVQRRRRHGLSEVPPVAVVTTGVSLPPDALVVTDVRVPTYVLTCASAPSDVRAAWAAAGAEVVLAGQDRVDLAAALAELEGRGLRRIAGEGGPHLFGSLLAAGLVDELRLTVSPKLVSGAAGRIAAGPPLSPAPVRLASTLTDGDTVLLRYVFDRAQSS
ncbi:pyrimidine reductase family protein [Fodinicola feengrottensis]|uniref:pyrimidine reductase family protein n=1 Tax=Fodinicola feengrottensis TaxID=435914 RepID=UPI0031D223DC